MCAAIENFFSSIYNHLKAVFGRSKIVFVNFIGVFLAVYVELQDYLISFNWDDFFKHEVAAGIGFATQILSMILRVYGSAAPVSFSAKVPVIEPVVPVAPVEELEPVQSPKAE